LESGIKNEGKMVKIDYTAAIQKLTGGLGIDTVTGNTEGFLCFHKYLEQSYPKLHKIAEVQKIRDYGLLYKIRGKTDNKPVCFMAHMDTVPAGDGWEHNAEGELKDNYIFGRGAFDMKGQLFAILEAAEYFLCDNTPKQDVYLFFGCDEESADNICAKEAAQLLKEQNIDFEYVIDEGGMLKKGELFGVEKDVAIIGTCEKGYLDIELVARSKGGHTSGAWGKTALTKACLAVAGLEKISGDVKLGGIAMQMINEIGMPDIPKPDNDEINAMLYDTYAPVTAGASSTMNVLPLIARIGINFRIACGNTIKNTLDRIKSVLPEDVEINVINGNEPTTVSNTSSPGYKKIRGAMQKLFPGAKIVPGMISVGTDCRHFQEICENVFRITPFVKYLEDSRTMHKPDERLSVDSFISAINFYYSLLNSVEC